MSSQVMPYVRGGYESNRRLTTVTMIAGDTTATNYSGSGTNPTSISKTYNKYGEIPFDSETILRNLLIYSPKSATGVIGSSYGSGTCYLANPYDVTSSYSIDTTSGLLKVNNGGRLSIVQVFVMNSYSSANGTASLTIGGNQKYCIYVVDSRGNKIQDLFVGSNITKTGIYKSNSMAGIGTTDSLKNIYIPAGGKIKYEFDFTATLSMTMTNSAWWYMGLANVGMALSYNEIITF